MRPPGLIILAAGGSSRMGRPKQLLPWKGQTLLRHACETALATKCRPVIVVLGREAAACQEALAGLDVICVINAQWEKGLGTSIASGVAALEKDAPDTTEVLLMLADQPTVTSAFLNALLAQWSPQPRTIVATKYLEAGGVPAIISSDYFEELRTLDSDRGAKALIARERSNVKLVAPDCELVDVDTAEVYEELHRAARRG